MLLEMTRYEESGEEPGFEKWKITKSTGGIEVIFPTPKVVANIFAKIYPLVSRRIEVEGPYHRGRFIYVTIQVGTTENKREAFLKALEERMVNSYRSEVHD